MPYELLQARNLPGALLVVEVPVFASVVDVVDGASLAQCVEVLTSKGALTLESYGRFP